jgi:hypothetical protein
MIIRILGIVAYAAIGIGLWQIYQPACPLGLGLLMWIDIFIDDWRKKDDPKERAR